MTKGSVGSHLNITSDQILTELNRIFPTPGFDMQPAEPYNGMPKWIGWSPLKMAAVEIIGDPIASFTLITRSSHYPVIMARNVALSYQFFKIATPGWEDSGKWFNKHLGKGKVAKRFLSDRIVTLNPMPDQGLLILSVRVKDLGQ